MTVLQNPPSFADSAWKFILEGYFKQFMDFFYPDLSHHIDWNLGFETLDKELQTLIIHERIGKRLADMLVKVHSKEGQPLHVLLHVEVQGSKEEDFPKRLYTYHYRIYDRYQIPVITLAILADNRRHWRPTRYQMSAWGKTTVDFHFQLVKLLDYEGQEDGLLAHENPFGIIVATHLATQKSQYHPTKRLEVKVKLTRHLYDRGVKREDIINLFKFVDWLMTIPEPLEIRYHEAIHQIEAEKKVEILTSIERIGMQQGQQSLITHMLKRKFSTIPNTYLSKIASADSSRLSAWGEKLVVANTLKEIFDEE